MLYLPAFETHANTQNLPHFRAFPASIQEHSPPKCLFLWQTLNCQIVPVLPSYTPPPHPDKPPLPSHPRGLDFGPFRLRLAPFGSVWLRLGAFRVRFGPISGVLGGVGERGFCKGKEFHYPSYLAFKHLHCLDSRRLYCRTPKKCFGGRFSGK